MVPDTADAGKPVARRRGSVARLACLLAGIVLGQCILFGPSLAGWKILLPLDILASRNVYLPDAPDAAKAVRHNPSLSDLVFQWEPARQFAVSEFRSGRLPMWTPYQYAGVTVVWPKFSPLLLLECCTASPVILAWVQLLASVIGGLGVYLFCRRVLSVGFWAAAISAWCFPLTGFFVFWQGYPTCLAVYWLPWELLAVDHLIRRGSLRAAAGLALVTGVVLVSGALDVSGQVLLASGLYALWRLVDVFGKQCFQRPAFRAALLLVAAWLAGFMLASPYILPLLEYAHTGRRMQQRSAGHEARPPVGLPALPQTVLPDFYGTGLSSDSPRILHDGSQNESSAAGYAGLFATLLVAPLAWCSRRHRSMNIFWAFLIFLGVGWCLDVPGLVALLRLPGLNMMSHNRLVFVASFAILALAATGLDQLARGGVSGRWWFLIPGSLMAGLCAWCLYLANVPPASIAAQFSSTALVAPDAMREAQGWFVRYYTFSALLLGAGAAAWWCLWRGRGAWHRSMVPLLGIVMVADLLWFAHGRSPQCDPSLYYPPIPALGEIAAAPPGRIVGFNCLPATLAQTNGLHDIRGYDAIDPGRLMDIMALAAHPGLPEPPDAMTLWFAPQLDFAPPDGVRLPPVLDMLGVRYVVFRGTPPQGVQPVFQSPGYWVLLNRAALDRAFVPGRVEVVADERERLQKLASPQFDPRAIAYVETPVDLPAACRGAAKITAEIPARIEVSVEMQTPGMVVLADLWDKGWKAYLDGRPVPILRADHAVRGVVVPAGNTTLEFRYEPDSFHLGLMLSGVAAVLLAVALAAGCAAQVSASRARSPRT